jgi:hypothetical protein
MGDRGNVRLLQHAGGDAGTAEIYLYAHWGGGRTAARGRLLAAMNAVSPRG